MVRRHRACSRRQLGQDARQHVVMPGYAPQPSEPAEPVEMRPQGFRLPTHLFREVREARLIKTSRLQADPDRLVEGGFRRG